MSFITGVGLTAFGRHEGSSSLDLMSKAAELANADAGASSARGRRCQACAGGVRREPADRTKPRRLDPGAGAGRPPRLRGAARADDPGLLRAGGVALHA